MVNRVTAGDYDCPRKVLKFLTDLNAAFRMLNLRNDFLRKKFDGIVPLFLYILMSGTVLFVSVSVKRNRKRRTRSLD